MKMSVTRMPQSDEKAMRNMFGGKVLYKVRGRNACCSKKQILVVENTDGSYACECACMCGSNTTSYDNPIEPLVEYLSWGEREHG